MKTLIQTVEIIEVETELIVEMIYFDVTMRKADIIRDVSSLLNYRADDDEKEGLETAIRQGRELIAYLDTSKHDHIRLVHRGEIENTYA